MQVILLRDVSGIGQKGSVKSVSDGHALNYLIPNRLAEMATPDKLKKLEAEKTASKQAYEAQEKEWNTLVKKLDGARITLTANASEQGHLYEKIHGAQLAAALKEQLQLNVPEQSIKPKMPIKQTGEWPIEIRLGNHMAVVTLSVENRK